MDFLKQIAYKTLEYYSNYPHLMREDILHTQEVVSYTKIIAEGIGLDSYRVSLLEAAAWLHDIGCPKSKEIYGNSLPVNQQSVGKVVAHEFLESISGLSAQEKEWIEQVVATHHQFAHAQRLDFQPLFEADIIANFLSGYFHISKAENMYNKLIVTESGRKLFRLVTKNLVGN